MKEGRDLKNHEYKEVLLFFPNPSRQNAQFDANTYKSSRDATETCSRFTIEINKNGRAISDSAVLSCHSLNRFHNYWVLKCLVEPRDLNLFDRVSHDLIV